ncbi:hypothetical protein [Halomonas sp. GT]|uniref:hypothetical protein n=1 Tax=Halomonas sp. GT TaxID=1971364 RepID=UPI0009F735F0|nr:hypothetical protein [Halomonas sp. GT]
MLIDPKIFVQQNNIHKNRKIKITLTYSDELIFYKLLDQNLESGKTVAITFPNEKLEEDSGLHKRIACCTNGKEFFDQMVDLAKTAIDAYRHFATKNIFGLWEVSKNLTQRTIYQAYKVEYAFDDETGTYFILLEPNGEGSDSKAWMYLA